MGGLEQQKDSCRDARGVGWVDSLRQDLRYAFRSLWKSPAFTLTAVVTLALAIGVNTAMFSVAEAVLVRPLPYTDPGSLVWITMRSTASYPYASLVAPDYLDWRRHAKTLTGMAAFTTDQSFNLTGIEQPERVRGAAVDSGFLPLLGVRPALGRLFAEPDDMPGAEPVAILSHGLWRRAFQSDPTVLGRSILLSGELRTVIGVLPPTFEVPGDPNLDLLVPLDLGVKSSRTGNGQRTVSAVLGRVRDETPPELVANELGSIVRGKSRPPYMGSEPSFDVEPLRQRLLGDSRLTVLVLMGASAMILLIGCGNVAHLSLVRSLARRREMAVRKAIGARRRRLVRQLLTESGVVCALGSGVGLMLADWTLNLVRTPASFSYVGQLAVDRGVLWFTLAAAVLTTLVSGLGPAFLGSRGDPGDVLKGGEGLASRSPRRSPAILTVSEVSLAIVLMTGAGLLLESLFRLTSREAGFQADNVLTVRVTSSRRTSLVSERSDHRAYVHEVERRLGSLPGVLDVALSSQLPLVEGVNSGPVLIEGQPQPTESSDNRASFGFVSGGYFRTLAIPVVQGRSFLPSDSANPDSVVVVNQAFVRRFGLGGNPIGQRIAIVGGEWASIVGVVGDVRRSGLAREPDPEWFLPMDAYPTRRLFVSIRSATPAAAVADAVRSTLAEIDPNQPAFDVATMESRLAAYIAPWRFNAVVLSVFAALALCMTAVGVYGVMSYQTARRTQEFGIRVALGARPGHLLWMAARQGFAAIAVGIAGGLVGTLALTRFLSHLLFDIQPVDPATFVSAATGLFSVGLVAVLLPTSRALRVNAVETLREG